MHQLRECDHVNSFQLGEVDRVQNREQKCRQSDKYLKWFSNTTDALLVFYLTLLLAVALVGVAEPLVTISTSLPYTD